MGIKLFSEELLLLGFILFLLFLYVIKFLHKDLMLFGQVLQFLDYGGFELIKFSDEIGNGVVFDDLGVG